MTDFKAYAAAGFLKDLLPILPHDAVIHPDSPAFSGLLQNKGKVPGRKRAGGWQGYGGWTDAQPDHHDIVVWAGWGAGVGMQGRRFPALDIDVDDAVLADAIHREASLLLGEAPVRFGRGSRRILVYAGAGFAKRRLAFQKARQAPEEGLPDELASSDRSLTHPEDTSSRESPVRSDVQAVEFLANGQQYVVEGIHPKTGQPYVWRDGRSPAVVGPDALAPVDAAKLDAFYERLEKLLDLYGYEVVSRSMGQGGDGGVWQEGLLAPSIDAIRRALAAVPNEVDYDTWLVIGRAIKAAAGPEREGEGLELFVDWSLQWPENTPEAVEGKWRSFDPPHRVGWDYLARFATDQGDGTFHAAEEDFDAIAEAPPEGEDSKGPPVSPKVERMFDRYVWVERMERICDMQTGELLTRTQFNVRNSHIGPPTSNSECAWAVFVSAPKRMRKVKGVTYRPGGELIVTENLPGLTGPCINRWTDPTTELPVTANEAEVAVWLDHVAFVIPDERERGILLDWLAWIVQNPGQKPNWSLVVGSTAEGMGKDMMLDPVRAALGAANVREIGPEDLASGNTDYLENTRLLIVEEMEMAERKAMMNKLKPMVAAPPYTLRVNIKFVPQFQVPNLLAVIFFTNMENALALTRQGRRYFVTWNDGAPRDEDYYVQLAAWFAAGGAAKSARWLLDRDVSAFNAKGRAPDTKAKDDMRKASRSRLDEWVEDRLEDRDGVLGKRLFTRAEVANELRLELPDLKVSDAKVGAALRRAGCIAAGRSLLSDPAQGGVGHGRREPTIFVRSGDELIGAEPAALRRAYRGERQSEQKSDNVLFWSGAAP
ncbi:MAG TPA: DUF5906 domain-containing protein [Brevundimonas sp.]|uniref:DUF5906 domain-containing protein n=1 Tax=Brevundimonas sp. TaxID=1871086 RepID=UPI002DEFB02C|nr:DUF5906 domain-containing protein [Brevundimonas sp.]